MRLLSGVATLALATQALSSPSDFEIRPDDEIPLQPEGTEGIPFRHQVPEKGQRKPDENEDIKMDGWRRGFSELKKVEEPALKTFEKGKGGGGGGGGGRSSGSSSSSGSKSDGTPSGASSPNSGSSSGGSASSLGTGALAGGAVGYMAGSHDDSSPSQNQSTSPSPQNCHYDNTHDDRLFFTLPPQLPEGKDMTVSVKTTWHLGYNEKLKSRLEKEAGLISTADPGKQCGWHTVQDVVKNTIHRGLIEFNVPENTTDTTITATATANNTTTTATSTSTPTFPPALQAKMVNVLNTSFPTMIGLYIGFLVSLILLALFFCCGGVRWCRRISRSWRRRKMRKAVLPTRVLAQPHLYPPPVDYGLPQQPARTYTYPYSPPY